MNKNGQHIIHQGESETLEYKTSFSDEVIISLVAFANAKGGAVCIGVADDGEIKGVAVGKETVQKWVNEIKNKIYNANIFNSHKASGILENHIALCSGYTDVMAVFLNTIGVPVRII